MKPLTLKQLQIQNDCLITLLKAKGITDNRIIQAFNNIPREIFITPNYQPQAYLDIPLPIGFGQTISQPTLIADITQQLHLTGHEKILEIGTGTGFHSAVLSYLSAHVHTVERIPQLLNTARKNHQQLHLTNITHHLADGTLGLPQFAPFDTIIVTASSPNIPISLIDQLKLHGKIAIPLGNSHHQHLILATKSADGLHIISSQPVLFVPLINQNTQSPLMHHHQITQILS